MNLVLKILRRRIQDLLPYDKFPFDTHIIYSTSALFTVKFQASSLGEVDRHAIWSHLFSFVIASRTGKKILPEKLLNAHRKSWVQFQMGGDDPCMLFGNCFYSTSLCCLKYFRYGPEKTNNLLKISLQEELSPRTHKTFITPSLCCNSLAGVDNSI